MKNHLRGTEKHQIEESPISDPFISIFLLFPQIHWNELLSLSFSLSPFSVFLHERQMFIWLSLSCLHSKGLYLYRHSHRLLFPGTHTTFQKKYPGPSRAQNQTFYTEQKKEYISPVIHIPLFFLREVSLLHLAKTGVYVWNCLWIK